MGCPFSVTGQPNAMGGREVGGLANQLAAHMAIEDGDARDQVQRFLAGAENRGQAGPQGRRSVSRGRRGAREALWIIATNPIDSLARRRTPPRLRSPPCPFVVVSDIVRTTDTNRFAHVLLPAAGWGEKDGNSSPIRSGASPASAPSSPRPARRETRLVDACRKSHAGWVSPRPSLSFDGPASIFREHAALLRFRK